MKQSIVVALVLLASTFDVSAQTGRNGNWWRDQTQATKVAYALGLIDGSSRLADRFREFEAGGVQGWRNAPPPTGFWSSLARLTGGQPTSIEEVFLRGVTAGQLTDGIDQLFAEATNRLIPATDAAWLVVFKIFGGPQAEYEELLTRLRSEAR